MEIGFRTVIFKEAEGNILSEFILFFSCIYELDLELILPPTGLHISLEAKCTQN